MANQVRLALALGPPLSRPHAIDAELTNLSSFGNLGGIIAVYAFLFRDRPLYIPGYAVCIAFSCLSAISSTIYFYGCYTANKQRRATTAVITDFEDQELGDLSPRYRYML